MSARACPSLRPPPRAPVHWHLLTGEYPPQPGGVSDYSRAVAEGLVARGESVTVWAPGAPVPASPAGGPEVRRLPQGFSVSGLRQLAGALAQAPRPARLLVQYVPHAFARRGLNVPLAAWLATQRHAELWVMFHEVAMPLCWGPGALQAGVQRAMGAALAWRARRVLVSTSAWEPLLPVRREGVELEWLPVPANVSGPVAEGARQEARRRVPGLAEAPVLGHFGTHGEAIAAPLREALRRLTQAHPTVRLLLLGRGSRTFHARLLAALPSLSSRSAALGGLPPEQLAPALAACDVMLQPYPEGVTTRRGTAMAALALGLPLVTNAGPLTEPLWHTTQAARLASRPQPAPLAHAALALLCEPHAALRGRAEAARRLYAERFALVHTLDRLLTPTGSAP